MQVGVTPMSAVQRQTLLIDGDDTLWKAQVLYQEAERQFRERLAAIVAVSPDIIQAKFDEINSALASTLGFREQRYPLAMEKTYEYFASQRGLALDPRQQQDIRTIAESVFTLTPELLDNAKEVLAALAEQYVLIFYSAGDERIQRGRLEQLDLTRFFSEVRVVLQKNEEELRRLLADFSLMTQNTWVIGNSPRFDIGPALRVGLRAIWLYSELWEDEKEDLVPRNARGELAPYATVFHLREVTSMLEAFPPKDPTEARLEMYATVLEDQEHASARRQNLTSVFIGLNTVALSGLAFLLASVRLDGAMYFDIVTGILIAVSAFITNRIYRKAMTKYDDLVTVSAVYLRLIEATLKDDLLVSLPASDGTRIGFHDGVMNVIGELRRLGKNKPRLTPEERADLIRKLKPQLEATDETVEQFAASVPYNVERALAKLFVRFFRYAAIVLACVCVLFCLGVIQAHVGAFSKVPSLLH